MVVAGAVKALPEAVAVVEVVKVLPVAEVAEAV